MPDVLKLLIYIPMFIAGGSVNCSRSINRYNGSECTGPNRMARLTMTIPNRGRKMYITANIAYTING